MKPTRKEFLQALETVEEYRSHVTHEALQVKQDLIKYNYDNIKLELDTNIYDCGLNTRVLNSIFAACEVKRNFYSVNKETIKIRDFVDLKITEVIKLRNVGKKTVREVEEFFLKVGVDIY